MFRNARFVLIAGFGSLLLVMALTGGDALLVLRQVRREDDGIRRQFLFRNHTLNEIRSDLYLSGRKMEGVWFQNLEASAAHQAQMPLVPAGKYHGLVVSPLRTARLDPPDVCLFYGNPAQMTLFINGLQWKRYRRYDFSITGESA